MRSLTSRGLSNFSHENKDFSIVFTNTTYKCSRVQAVFLSPLISSQTQETPELLRFDANIPDDKFYFQYVLEMLEGKRVIIPPESSAFMEQISHIFCNEELSPHHEEEMTLNPSNCISAMKAKLIRQESAKKEIEYIANHLFEIDEEDLSTVDIGTQREIFQHPKARIENESWLFAFIFEEVEKKGDEYIQLFETVDFCKLSNQDISKFIQFLPVSKLTQTIWESIGKSILFTRNIKSQEIQNVQRKEEIQEQQQSSTDNFPNKEEGSLEGIISYLTKQCCGNVHDKGIVNISSSSTFIFFYPQNSVDYSTTKMFQTGNEEHPWIQFSFTKSKVNISSYTIISKEGQVDDHHLRSWHFEGSNDGEKWTILDERLNNIDLNGSLHKKTFFVQRRGQYCQFRILMTEVSHSGSWILAFSAIEFFGQLIEN